jgi:hypothetical protein
VAPAVFRPVAVIGSVDPTLTLVAGAVIATLARFTVSASGPLTVPDVAVMVTAPTPTAVTSPVVDTVAIAPLDDAQVKVTPLMGALNASRAVAVNCTVFPVAIVVAGALTAIVATTGGGTGVTVMANEPDCPPLVAVMDTGPPAATAVTTPVLASTVAMLGFDDAHAKTAPGT